MVQQLHTSSRFFLRPLSLVHATVRYSTSFANSFCQPLGMLFVLEFQTTLKRSVSKQSIFASGDNRSIAWTQTRVYYGMFQTMPVSCQQVLHTNACKQCKQLYHDIQQLLRRSEELSPTKKLTRTSISSHYPLKYLSLSSMKKRVSRLSKVKKTCRLRLMLLKHMIVI